MKLLSNNGILYIGGGYSGPEAYQDKIVKIDGVEIAFLAFSEFNEGEILRKSLKPGIAIISEDEIKESVLDAKSKADLVIVSYHFGEEYAALNNNYQKKYAELAIDYGADLIIGHHPHVVQNLGQYMNTYIVYSLGNFIFDQHFSKKTMEGGLLEVLVDIESKQIKTVTLKKVLLNSFFQIESIE